MEYEVKLNPTGVKRLRDSRSWTQEHLAEASGVSLRTIQRMESEGTASAESRLAIAAALGVPVENIHLALECGSSASAGLDRVATGRRWGYAGLLAGSVASAAGILSGGQNPAEAAEALGLLGAFTGVFAAGIGILSQRAAQRVLPTR